MYKPPLEPYTFTYQHKTHCGIYFSGGSIPSPEPSPDHTNSSTGSPRQATNRVSPKTGVEESKGPQNGPLFSKNLRHDVGLFLDIREPCRRAHRNES